MLGYIPSMARADIDEAASAAKRAQEDWRTVPVYKKAEYLYRTADLLEENEAELVDTLVMEIAKDKNRRFQKSGVPPICFAIRLT